MSEKLDNKDLKKNTFIQNFKKLQKEVDTKISKIEKSKEPKAKKIVDDVSSILIERIKLYKEDKKLYNLLKNELEAKYSSSNYRSLFRKLDENKIENCLLSMYTVKDFFDEIIDNSKKNKLTYRYDFYSVYLGFEGWYDAVEHDFDIEKKVDFFEENDSNDSVILEKIKKIEKLIKKVLELRSETQERKQNKDTILTDIKQVKVEIKAVSEQFKNSRESFSAKKDFEEKLNQILEKTLKGLSTNIHNTTNVFNTTNINTTNNTQINNLQQINIFIKELERLKELELHSKEKTTVDKKEETKKLEKENIPRIVKSSFYLFFWQRIKLFFGFKKWVYNLNGSEPMKLTGEIVYDNFTKNYIPAYFQLDKSIYDKNIKNALSLKTNKVDDILSYLKRHVLEKKELPNNKKGKYFFILAGSGIGKTTLLLKLYLEAKKTRVTWDNIYFLPFSKWKQVTFLKESEKYNSVLLLDSMDEDFELDNKQSIKKIMHELKQATKDFGRVIITSRDLFFRDKDFIQFFTNTVGDEEYFEHKTIVLSPFTDEQVQTYLNKKFKHSKKDKAKAYGVLNIIGGSMQRQLLISKIDLLLNVKKDENYLKETKDYYLFNKMLTGWLEKEKYKFKNLETIKRLENENALDKKNTYEFCEILAEKIRNNETKLSYENIVNLKDTKYIKKSKLLINRSFLLLDINNNYRFAHNSIYEFFLAKKAIKNLDFDRKCFYFRNPIRHGVDEFSRKIYKQGVAKKFQDLKNNPLSKYIYYTTKNREIYQYAQDIRFEPFFRVENINGKQKQLPYIKRHWTPISKLKIDQYNKIIGVKFICNKGIDIISESLEQKEIRLSLRQECFDLYDNLNRYLTKPTDADYSEITYQKGNILGGISLNLRGANYKSNGLILNNQRNEHKSITINFRGIRVNELYFELGAKPLSLNLIFDYTDYLFKYLLEEINQSSTFKIIPENIYIFLSNKDLEKGGDNDIGKIVTLSKLRLFVVTFFTKERILDNNDVSRLAERKLKSSLFTTPNLKLFFTKSYYRSFSESMFMFNTIELKKDDDFQVDLSLKYNTKLKNKNSHDLILKMSAGSKDTNHNKLENIIKKANKRITKIVTFAVNPIEELYYLNEFILKKRNSVLSLDISRTRPRPPSMLKLQDENKDGGISELISEESKEGQKSRKKDIINPDTYIQKISNLENKEVEQNKLIRSIILNEPIKIEIEELTFTNFKNVKETLKRFNESSIKSLILKKLDIREFKMDIINSLINLESLYVESDFIKNIDFKGINKLKYLKQVIFISENEKIKAQNLEEIINLPKLDKLLIDLKKYTSLKFTTQPAIKNLTIPIEFLKIFEKSPYIEILTIISESQGYNLVTPVDFMTDNHKYLKEIYWHNPQSIGFLKDILKQSLFKIEKLSFKCNYPNKDNILLIDSLFGYLSHIKRLKHLSVTFYGTEEDLLISCSSNLKSILTYLIEIKCEVNVNFDTQITLKNSTEKTTRNCGFNLTELKEDRQLSLKIIEKESLKKKYSYLYTELWIILNELFKIDQLKIYNINIPLRILETKSLDIYEENLSTLNWEYYNKRFYNLQFDNYFEIMKSPLNSFPINDLRLINVILNINKESFFYLTAVKFNWGSIKKISFTSLKGVDLSFLKEKTLIKEVEILSYYMPKEEKKNITKYIEECKDVGLIVSVRETSFEIKNKKGIIFETHVTED